MQKILILSLVFSINMFAADASTTSDGSASAAAAAGAGTNSAAGTDSHSTRTIGSQTTNSSRNGILTGAFVAGLILRTAATTLAHKETTNKTRELIIDARNRGIEITTENKNLYEAKLSAYDKYNQLNAAAHITVAAAGLAALMIDNEKFNSIVSRSANVLGAVNIAELALGIYVSLPRMLNFDPGKIEIVTKS